MQKTKRLVLTLFALFLGLPTFRLAAQHVVSPQDQPLPTPRHLLTDDLLQLEKVGDNYAPFSFSPDGKSLAYVLVRSKAGSTKMKQESLVDEDRSDVWLAATERGTTTNITNGSQDGSGFFMPSWSPDSNRLAMLSTRGGNLGLWVWTKTSGQIRPLTQRAVNLSPFNDVPFVWISNETLVCSVLPEGEKPRAIFHRNQAADIAVRQWLKAWKGEKPTASTLESGVPSPLSTRPQGKLLMIDAISRETKEIATGTFRSLTLSPDRTYIAALKQTSVFQPDNSLSLDARPLARLARMGYQLIVADAHGNVLPAVTDIDNVYTLSWSSDGKELAVMGEQPGVHSPNTTVFVYSPENHKVRRVAAETLDPSALVWTPTRQLLVLANRRQDQNLSSESRRLDWWLISDDKPSRNLTAEMKSAPPHAVQEPNSTFIAVAGGDLWQIPIDVSSPQKLSLGLDGLITAIVWPTISEISGSLSKMVVQANFDEATEYYLVDLSSHAKVPIPKPDPSARIVDFNPQTNAALMMAATRRGTFLWFSYPNSHNPLQIVETNTFLRGIAEGEPIRIEYRSIDGRALNGWVILPVNYRKGKKYPLVAWVYPGQTYGKTPPVLTNLNMLPPLNPQLLSAHGYAVLFPSIPIDPPGNVSEVYFELANGVIPAVDKVIDMGIADPKGLGIMGQSWGGYAAYSLITQTTKFRAAAALAGITDYTSLYGEFAAETRYSDFPQELKSLLMYDIEGTAWYDQRLGVPPWKDTARYLRNSPIFYVERVQTPVLIIQGDMDYVPLQQGEQFFSSLYRQNKRARFVRYWGEGHVLESPANIRDMWQRVYDWFDEFLVPTPLNNQADAAPAKTPLSQPLRRR